MESKEKIVDFDKYCLKCKNFEIVHTEEPCNECLHEPVNIDSRKPVKFEPKD